MTDVNTRLPAHGRSSKRTKIIISAVSTSLVLVLGFGVYGVATASPDETGRAVEIGGMDASMLTRDELKKRVESLSTAKINVVSDDSGDLYKTSSKSYSLSDLGIKIDVDKTVDATMSAKNNVLRGLPIPYAITPVYTVDEAKLESTLTNDFVKDSSKAVEPSIAYENGSFVVKNGRDGYGADLKAVETSLKTHMSTLVDSDDSIKLVLDEEKPNVDGGKVKAAADKANAIISSSLTVSNLKGSISPTRDELAGFLTVGSDGSLSTNDENIKKWLDASKGKIEIQMQPQETLISPNNVKIATAVYGSDGTSVNVDKALASIKKSILSYSGQPMVVSGVTDLVKMEDKQTIVAHDWDKENGTHWLKVDLSGQKVYAYAGSTLVNTFNVATGANTAGKRTDPGSYYVNVKYTSQTMRGEDYVTPNVRWVSYFNGGEGFHAAPWNAYNISVGYPSSHGCVNMNPDEAKWIYDFAPLGTRVDVVGSTPAGSAR